MYTCFKHNWFSIHSQCPCCVTTVITSASTQPLPASPQETPKELFPEDYIKVLRENLDAAKRHQDKRVRKLLIETYEDLIAIWEHKAVGLISHPVAPKEQGEGLEKAANDFFKGYFGYNNNVSTLTPLAIIEFAVAFCKQWQSQQGQQEAIPEQDAKDKEMAELRGDVLYWKRIAEMPEDDKWNVDRQLLESELSAAKERIAELEAYLEGKIRECESVAEELIQEYDDEEGGNGELDKASAFQEVLDFLNNKQP